MLIPSIAFWVILIAACGRLSGRGLLVCIAAWSALCVGLGYTSLPPFVFVAAQAAVDCLLVMIVAGGAARGSPIDAAGPEEGTDDDDESREVRHSSRRMFSWYDHGAGGTVSTGAGGAVGQQTSSLDLGSAMREAERFIERGNRGSAIEGPPIPSPPAFEAGTKRRSRS